MTDTRLYLMIGVPILANAAMFILLAACINTRINRLIQRLDHNGSMWSERG
jgi:hypothetical protein